MTVHRLNDGPPDRSSAPQGNQCLLSRFLTSLGAQEKANCSSMLWSIDSYQNRVSADQYQLTVQRAQVSTHQGRVFFEVIRWQITSFKWSPPFFFLVIHMKYVVFVWTQTWSNNMWSKKVKGERLMFMTVFKARFCEDRSQNFEFDLYHFSNCVSYRLWTQRNSTNKPLF